MAVTSTAMTIVGCEQTPLFQRGARLPQDSCPAGSLEDIDDPREWPRFQRGSWTVSFAILDDPVVRGDQLGFADPGRNDFCNDDITDRSEDLDRLITRQFSHDRYLPSARSPAVVCIKRSLCAIAPRKGRHSVGLPGSPKHLSELGKYQQFPSSMSKG